MILELLGVKINYPYPKKNFEKDLESMLQTKDKKFIFTVNPEFIVDSVNDSLFKKILNKGFFNSADGIGVVFALEYQEHLKAGKSRIDAIKVLFKDYLKGSITSKRLTGVEISEKIFEFSNKNYKNIFLLGGDSRKLVSEKLLIDLERKYPNINFIGASSSFSSKPNDDSKSIEYINSCLKSKGQKKIDFILVGYGHPYQEKWIERNHTKVPANVFIGVGGTFDFLSGSIKRAPKLIQKIGLEWLFRLIMQPSRFKRIYKAVVTFSYLIITKIKH